MALAAYGLCAVFLTGYWVRCFRELVSNQNDSVLVGLLLLIAGSGITLVLIAFMQKLGVFANCIRRDTNATCWRKTEQNQR